MWADAEVTVRRIVTGDDDVTSAANEVQELLEAARFPAKMQVVREEGEPFEVIRRYSAEADLIFLGLRPRGAEESLADYAAYYAALARHTEGLPPTALVSAGDEVDLHRLFAGA